MAGEGVWRENRQLSGFLFLLASGVHDHKVSGKTSQLLSEYNGLLQLDSFTPFMTEIDFGFFKGIILCCCAEELSLAYCHNSTDGVSVDDSIV